MPFVLLLTLLVNGQAVPQARLSDEQIDQVIAYARTSEGPGGARCYATAASGGIEAGSGFAVSLEGPAGRIFDAVKAAQARGLNFTRGQVRPEMAATTLVVVAYPEAPKHDAAGWHYAPPATGVMIRAGGPQRAVIKPRTTETVPTTWQNATGTATRGQGVHAVFLYQDFATIHLGDFEVVVLAGQAERVCTIDSVARASIK